MYFFNSSKKPRVAEMKLNTSNKSYTHQNSLGSKKQLKRTKYIMWLRRRLSCCINILLLVSFGFILNKNSVECRGKKPVGYEADNVFGCKCGMGMEGSRRNDVRRIVRKRREFDSEEVKNLTLNRSKR